MRVGGFERKKPNGRTCFLKQMSTSCHSGTQTHSFCPFFKARAVFSDQPTLFPLTLKRRISASQTWLLWCYPNSSSRCSSFAISCVSHLLGLIIFFNIFISFWISKVCSWYKIQKVQKLHRQKPETEMQLVPKNWQSLDLNAGWRGTHAFDHGWHCWVIKSGLLISSAHREVRNYIFLHHN